jgi:SAM-dependent methyltransferase
MRWFGSACGLTLLAAERDRVAALLASRAPQPWLWLAPGSGPGPDAAACNLPPRGLRLHREHAQLAGCFRCALPLPLPSESFGSIVVQHVLDDGGLPGFLDEAARVLQPGGHLWLFALNPYSPYRLRWRRAGLHARNPIEWRLRLRAVGLHVDEGSEAAWLGPVWRETASLPALAGLRAVCVLGAEKRSLPLTPAKSLAWRRPDAAPAGF